MIEIFYGEADGLCSINLKHSSLSHLY
jgi:hypothetical protein